IWLYIFIRFSFLFAYEFFFRGVLLQYFLEFNSLFLAIVFSTILYVLIHIFDDTKEKLGAIPFGVILCLLAYYTKSIWYVFIIHLALSAVYEISIFYYQTLKTTTS
ncbi:MAG: CPBP family intramembrane metalloprotease, partial [Flavobacteriaceae bacterium]|nr:CPBP family intramembrane metalloprotease [Flavobacteriaceae bacterium]